MDNVYIVLTPAELAERPLRPNVESNGPLADMLECESNMRRYGSHCMCGTHRSSVTRAR
jgi:hypothetical protein